MVITANAARNPASARSETPWRRRATSRLMATSATRPRYTGLLLRTTIAIAARDHVATARGSRAALLRGLTDGAGGGGAAPPGAARGSPPRRPPPPGPGRRV